MRILLFGRNGQVGWELHRMLAPLGQIIALDFPEVDFSKPDGLRSVIQENQPDIIINAAAYTAVDRAEQEPERAMAVNGIAPGILAEEAAALRAGFVHYSTDYVFDGMKGKPYTEEDVPNPLNVYGRTKLAGDQAVMAAGGAWIILRTSWVYGLRGNNFLLTIRRLARERTQLRIVGDQVGNPTWCRSIAQATAAILGLPTGQDGKISFQKIQEFSGIYNYSAEGETSWFAFAQAILASDSGRKNHLVKEILPIPTEQYPTPAKRPLYSGLSKLKIQQTLSIPVFTWEDQLAACLREQDPGVVPDL